MIQIVLKAEPSNSHAHSVMAREFLATHNLPSAIGEFEKRFIKGVLDRVEGNQSRAAELLGIHRNTLSRKITEYKLDGRRRAVGR